MSFTIKVQPSGRIFEADGHTTVLNAAIQQSIGLPYGCKDGACGSCKSRLVEGQVVHGNHQTKALSDQDESDGWILTCCATAQSDLVIENKQVSAAGQFPILKMPARVTTLTRAAADVMVLRLQLPAQTPLMYHAGQYIEFILKDGSRRSYSMANAPSTISGGIELHIRHLPGGKFTDHVFGAMKEKEILRIEGPYGSFFLREESQQPIILLASGTGFAPIKAMIELMIEKHIHRPTYLYWGGRTLSDLYMKEWIEEKTRTHDFLQFIPVLSASKPEDGWNGRTGWVHQAVMQDHPQLSEFQVYACGAPLMVEAAQKDFVAECGLPPESFFADSFTSEADKHHEKSGI